METGLFGRAREDAATHGPARELQAFRGIAALVVLVYHSALYFDYAVAPRSWVTTVFNAHAAVVSFFVLSGFLLSLSLMRMPASRGQVRFFYLRRAFRIYPALWLGCLAGLGYLLVVGGSATNPPTSSWAIVNFTSSALTPGHVLLAFAGMKSTLPLPIWSLAVELVASLLMPWMIFVMRRSTPAFAIVVGLLVLVSVLGFDRPFLVPTYLAGFAIGASIALLAPAWRRLARFRAVAMPGAIGGFALMWFVRGPAGADFDLSYHQGIAATLEAVGAALLIGTIYVRSDLFRWLGAAPAVRLGDISYSLYLLHQPAIGVIAAVGLAVAPHWVAMHPGLATIALTVATAATTIPLANWCFRNIELPAIGLGQRLVRTIERGRPPPGRPGQPAAAMQMRG